MPAGYKIVTIKLLALTWEAVLAVKTAMASGVPAPGADLAINRDALVKG